MLNQRQPATVSTWSGNLTWSSQQQDFFISMFSWREKESAICYTKPEPVAMLALAPDTKQSHVVFFILL